MLKLKPGMHLDTAQARSISNLVAGSVEGLKPQNLTIVDVNGNTLTPDDTADSLGLTTKQMDTQRGYESSMEKNLQAMLDRVLGTGKAAVRVSAVMNWDQVEQTSETYTPSDPTQTPVLTSHAVTETNNGGQSTAGGVPGPAANNGAVPTYQGTSAGNPGSSSKSDVETTYQLNKSTQKTVVAPGAVKRLSVSVMLDDDPNNPNPALAQNVQNAINAAAGIDASRGDILSVTPIAFNNTEMQTTQAQMADAAQKEQLVSYAHIGALALGPILLLIVLFFMLRRRKPAAQVVTTVIEAVPSPELVAGGTEITDGAAPAIAGRPMKPGLPIPQPIVEDPQKQYIREQITSLGSTNPATVAQLIQTWMDEDRRN